MCYVYKFLDSNESLLYIGKTTSTIKNRMAQHFNNGHLDKSIYKEVDRILYSKCLNRDDMSIKERYLIATQSPKYNTSYNNNNSFNFVIDDFNWLEFNYKEKLSQIVPRKKTGIIDTKDKDITKRINKRQYIIIEHNGVTPRSYGYLLPACIRPERKIYYLVIDGEVYIYLKTFDSSGDDSKYRVKLMNNFGLKKSDLIILIDRTKSTISSSSDRKITLVKINEAIETVGKDIQSYKGTSLIKRNNEIILEEVKGLKKYLSNKTQSLGQFENNL